MSKTYIKVEVTLADGRKIPIEHSVVPGYYESNLAHLQEIYGDKNVREIS